MFHLGTRRGDLVADHAFPSMHPGDLMLREQPHLQRQHGRAAFYPRDAKYLYFPCKEQPFGEGDAMGMINGTAGCCRLCSLG